MNRSQGDHDHTKSIVDSNGKPRSVSESQELPLVDDKALWPGIVGGGCILVAALIVVISLAMEAMK